MRWIIVTALALRATALPVAAQQFSTPAPWVSPIVITSCEFTERKGLIPHNGLRITWINNRQIPLKTIDFEVKYGGETQRAGDQGTYTHGATISKSFNLFTNFQYVGPRPDACRVAQAIYADDTSVVP